MPVVSSLELGESLVSRNKTDDPGHSHLFTWCSPASSAFTERVYRPITPLSREDAQDTRKAACLNACLA